MEINVPHFLSRSLLGLLATAACDTHTNILAPDRTTTVQADRTRDDHNMKVGPVAFTPNPRMVTAAVAHVECSRAIKALQISYAAPGVDAGQTPRVAVSSCPADVTLLGLLPSTRYVTRVTAWGEDGEARSVTGPAVMTDALPHDLPQVTTQMVGSASPGLTEFAVFSRFGQPPSYALVVDSMGRIRWYLADSGGFIFDLEPQRNGHYTLSIIPSGRNADFAELGPAGNVLRRWDTLGGYSTDIHDFCFEPTGTALMLGAAFRTVDLRAYGGSPTARVLGNALERVDSLGRVLFLWSAFDHLSITDIDPSLSLRAPFIDWTHYNAIEIDRDGNYLVSARNLSEITKIDAQTGDLIWRWGGVRNEFQFRGDTLQFSFQHAITRLRHGNYLLFDNGNTHNPPFSRAVEYHLDQNAKTATLVWSYRPNPALFTPFLGFAQRLSNGNTLVSFGILGTIHEVSPSSQLVWTLRAPSGNIYRAYRIRSLYDPRLVNEPLMHGESLGLESNGEQAEGSVAEGSVAEGASVGWRRTVTASRAAGHPVDSGEDCSDEGTTDVKAFRLPHTATAAWLPGGR